MTEPCKKCGTNCMSEDRLASDVPKVFVLIHDDAFLEDTDVYGVFTTREKAAMALEKQVPEDVRAGDSVRIVEYELDKFFKDGHFDHFEDGD